MGEGCDECKSCADLKIEDVKKAGVLDRILERMDNHDKLEETKRKERRDEARNRRNNFITIILFLLVIIIGFSKWLNDFTHGSDLRLQKIETVLGVKQKDGKL